MAHRLPARERARSRRRKLSRSELVHRNDGVVTASGTPNGPSACVQPHLSETPTRAERGDPASPLPSQYSVPLCGVGKAREAAHIPPGVWRRHCEAKEPTWVGEATCDLRTSGRRGEAQPVAWPAPEVDCAVERRVWKAEELEQRSASEQDALFEESIVTDLDDVPDDFLEKVRARLKQRLVQGDIPPWLSGSWLCRPRTVDFFQDLDRQLPTERGPNGEPSTYDFQSFELLRIVERFATGFQDLAELIPGRSDYRILEGRLCTRAGLRGSRSADARWRRRAHPARHRCR